VCSRAFRWTVVDLAEVRGKFAKSASEFLSTDGEFRVARDEFFCIARYFVASLDQFSSANRDFRRAARPFVGSVRCNFFTERQLSASAAMFFGRHRAFITNEPEIISPARALASRGGILQSRTATFVARHRRNRAGNAESRTARPRCRGVS
jgi:hypothetical protein